MKRTAKLFLGLLLALCLMMPSFTFAEDTPPVDSTATSDAATEATPPATEAEEATTMPEVPKLTQITFNNAEIDGAFHSDVLEYTLTISDHSGTIRPASYKCTDYNAQVQLHYLTNTSGDASGLIIRLSNDGGSTEYKFIFDTIKEIKKTPDASLMSLTFDFGELSPKFDAEIYKYNLYLPSDLEVLNIYAVPSDENAKLNTPRQIKLSPDQNAPVAVKITSSDGTNTAVYKLNIKRVDKTIAQIKAEMENPGFTSFVDIPFYQTAPFYVILGVVLFLVALALVLFFTLRKKKSSDETEPDAENVTPPEEEKEALPADKTTERYSNDVPAANLSEKEATKPAPSPTGPTAPQQENAQPDAEQESIAPSKRFWKRKKATAQSNPGQSTDVAATATPQEPGQPADTATQAVQTQTGATEPDTEKEEAEKPAALITETKPKEKKKREKKPHKLRPGKPPSPEESIAPATPLTAESGVPEEDVPTDGAIKTQAPAVSSNEEAQDKTVKEKPAEHTSSPRQDKNPKQERNPLDSTSDWLDLDKYNKYK